MGWRVDKQSNGKFKIWSTIVDDYIWCDCTENGVIRLYQRRHDDQQKILALKAIKEASQRSPKK